MIEELTPEQEAQMEVYRDKFLAIGLSTEDPEQAFIEQAVFGAYANADLEAPKQIIWLDSPLAGAMFHNRQEGRKLADIDVEKEIKELEAEIKKDVDSITLREIGQVFYGHHEVHWLAFYAYFRDVVEVDLGEDIQPLINLAHAGWQWFYDEAAVITHKPTELHHNDNGQHCETGPAIKYRDGFEIFALNGVRVPRWLVETTVEDMDCKKIYEIDNAEIRREFIRKVGIEKIYVELGGKILDEEPPMYKLVLLNMGDDRERPYLLMENPSIEAIHLEGVHPDCKTVDEALHFRKPEGLKKIKVDDVNGEEWHQQGDVVMFNKDAKSVKNRPSSLS